MTAPPLTPHARQLLRWCRRNGARGLAVAGLVDKRAVEQLVAQRLVRVEEAPSETGYSGVIYPAP